MLPGAEVVYFAEVAGPPRRKYWLWNEQSHRPARNAAGERTYLPTGAFHWRFAVDVELAGEWVPDRHSGSMQDTCAMMISFIREVEPDAILADWSNEATGERFSLGVLLQDG